MCWPHYTLIGDAVQKQFERLRLCFYYSWRFVLVFFVFFPEKWQKRWILEATKKPNLTTKGLRRPREPEEEEPSFNQKKVGGSNREGGEKTKKNKANHLAIMNYENRLLIKKRFIVAVNEKCNFVFMFYCGLKVCVRWGGVGRAAVIWSFEALLHGYLFEAIS